MARALAVDPPFLLMDEPFGALDPLTRAELQREFLALQERLQKTVVFVTHDLREALLLGSRIALSGGRATGRIARENGVYGIAKPAGGRVQASIRRTAIPRRPLMNLWQFMLQNHGKYSNSRSSIYGWWRSRPGWRCWWESRWAF